MGRELEKYFFNRLTLMLAVLALTMSKGVVAQPAWAWAKDVHTSADEYAKDVAICPQSNDVVVVGRYENSLSSYFNSPFSGCQKGGFVAKYDANGNIKWGFPIGSNHNNFCNGVCVDSLDNIYVTGAFESSTDFRGISSSSTILTAAGTDFFIAKYSSSGQLLWVKKGGGNSSDEGKSVTVNSNAVFVSGHYQDNAVFGMLTSFANFSNQNAFIVSLDLNGNYQWLIDAGSSQFAHANDIVSDNNGVYMIGEFEGGVLSMYNSNGLPAAAAVNVNPGNMEAYVASYSLTGLINWAGLISSYEDEMGSSIAIFGNSVFITGTMKEPVNLPGYVSNPLQDGNSGYDMFVAKLNRSNGNTIWAKCESSGGDDEGKAIDADALGNVYVCGYFKNYIDFAGGPTFSASGGEEEQIIIAAYSSTGNYLWAKAAGENNADVPYGIVAVSSNEIYICGEYDEDPSFGNTTLVNDGGQNMFLVKLGCPLISNNFISSSQIVCSGSVPASLVGSVVSSGASSVIYKWERSSDSLNWSTASGTSSLTNYSPPALSSSYYFRRLATLNNGCGTSDTSNMVFIEVDQLPTVANAGPDKNYCLSSAVSLAGNTPVNGSGIWTVMSGNASIADPSDPVTSVNFSTGGVYVFQWQISNGVCPASVSTVDISIDDLPSSSNAGTDLAVCVINDTISLSANAPLVGNGVWNVVSGEGTFVDPSDNNTLAYSVATGNNVFSWTITNGVCPPSVSNIDVRVDVMPDSAFAGENVITDIPSVQLSANQPLVGIAAWSMLSGNGAFSSATDPQATINNLSIGDNIIRWEIKNGVCPSRWDEITITMKPFTIPNGFSPNGDGINDTYSIKALDYYSNVTFRVFNRWGNIVYESNEYRNSWDGISDKGQKLADDTYYFTLEIMEDMEYSGYVIIKTK